VLPLVSPSPCMSIFSLQFAQEHNLGRSSCDAFGLAFTVHVQLQFAVVQKHNLGRSSCFASGLAFIVYVQLQAHSLLKNTIWGDPVGMASNENKAGYTQSPSMIRSVPTRGSVHSKTRTTLYARRASWESYNHIHCFDLCQSEASNNSRH
jgi:hypothetical protein